MPDTKTGLPSDEELRLVSRGNWDHQWGDTTGGVDLRDSNWRHVRCKHCGTLRNHKGVATEHRDWCSARIDKTLREVRGRTERATKARTLRWAADQIEHNPGQRWVVAQALREAAEEAERG
jgi:hypothetical protein